MSFKEVLRYGNWSGPGWTAGKDNDWFSNEGYDRAMTDADRALDGIDAYDNYVAKAHDLNEFAAIDALRGALARLALIQNDVVPVGGGAGYADRLVFPDDPSESSRFASYNQYARRLDQSGGNDEARQDLAYAFVLYYLHAAFSNRQFALDYVLHRPSVWNVPKGAFRMELQLRFGPNYFLEEANGLESQAYRVAGAAQIAMPTAREVGGYMDSHFVTPHRPNFSPVRGAYVPILTAAALGVATRPEIAELQNTLVSTAQENARLDQIFSRYRPQGCSSVAQALETLDYL